MNYEEFQERFFKLEAEVGLIEQKLAYLINENKVKEIEEGIYQVIKQIKATIKDINSTPLQ
jgi:hypothetical protein